MRLLGAAVRAVDSGSRTLKDAINEAMRDWSASVRTTHYLLGSVLGPHPYPTMVRDFQSVIGRETRGQVREISGGLPDLLVACVGGGSNAIGLFHEFLVEPTVRMVGVEAGGEGIATGRHAARFAEPTPGVLHGTRTQVLQDAAGLVRATHSVSAGLDYPAVGPEHAALHAAGRVRYDSATDAEALEAFDLLARTEGILPALESAHALAWVLREGRAGRIPRDALVVLNLSGRGDKDLGIVLGLRAPAPKATATKE
jgi:tryptophan synthase beta chain